MEWHIKAPSSRQHTEKLFTMHLTIKHSLIRQTLGMIALILLLSCRVFGDANLDRNTWLPYTAEQKQLAVAGFSDCYRSASPNNAAFANSDIVAVVRMIDGASPDSEKASFGNLILKSFTEAPTIKSDVHAEHWKGPTGFHSGLWWRGIEDDERKAYVQGAFWCAQATDTVSINPSQPSVEKAVNNLNDWYVVSDDDWSNPLSNARVDVAVILALQKVEILHIKKTK